MAADKGQKTEKPTEKRRRDAKKQGQVVKSQDLVPWLLVLVATFALPAYLSRASTVLSERLARVRLVAAEPTPAAAQAELGGAMMDVFGLMVPVLLAGGAIALVATLAQTGLVLSPKAMKPQFKRLDPVAGLKRIVSRRGQWEAAKAVLRLLMVGIVSVPLVMDVADELAGREEFAFGAAAAYLGDRLIDLARLVAVLGLVVSAADYVMQRRNQMRDLRMSKQEIKDEHKQADGDPLVRGRMRRAAQQLSRNRMLAAAGEPTVIVVNPTHYAVALRYDEQIGVPLVVAKGIGARALKIRADGLAKSIPVVECRPLARALHRVCVVGTPVPAELFQGVAILLAFVHRLGARRSLGGVHVMPHDVDALALPARVLAGVATPD